MNLSDLHSISLFKNQEKKRESERATYEATQLNQELQSIVRRLITHLKLDEIEEWVKEADEQLIQSSVLELKYVNNFESSKVLAVQLLFCRRVIKNFEVAQVCHLQQELYKYEERLRYLDSRAYFWYRKEL